MPKSKQAKQTPTPPTPATPPAPKVPGTAVVPVGKARDASSLKYKAQRGLNRARAGLHKAGNVLKRNKAAAIASGLGVAGVAGAGALGYAAGKRQAKND